MKRSLISAAAVSVLALVLLPASACAAMPGDLDRNLAPAGVPTTYMVDPGDPTIYNVRQSFTAGVTGALTHVELYCGGVDGPVTVDLYFFTYHEASAVCASTAGWVDFTFNQSQLMAAGSGDYLRIVPSDVVMLGVAASGSSGGAAGDPDGNPISGVADFAFRTYVLPLQTLSGVWNPASVVPGSPVAATLTFTAVFPAVSLVPLVAPVQYEMRGGSLPAYFSPTDITCSPEITDCTLANYLPPAAGLHANGAGGALTLSVTISGTLDPPAEEEGEAVSVNGGACLFAYDDPGEPTVRVSMCEWADADLQIGNPATPPPTTATGGSRSSGSGLPLWLLPAALVAALSSLLVIRRRIWLAR